MFVDIAAASSLFSTLALFLSKGNKNIDRNSIAISSLQRTTRISVPSCRFTSALNNDSTSTSSVVPTKSSTSDNLFVGEIIEKEKYLDLLTWLKKRDATINECLEIKESSQGQGYGLYVNKSIPKDELLFSIPRSLWVTMDKATSSTEGGEDEFGNTLKALIEKAGPGGATVSLACYMAKEYILLCLEEEEEENQSSRWGPYFKTLPWKRGINNQEHILFWTNEKIETLLKGSLCYEEARSLRKEVSFSIKVLGPLLKKSINASRRPKTTKNVFEQITSILPWQKDQQDNDENDVVDDKIISDAIKGAFVNLLTRSFLDDDENEKLVPLLDLMQHSNTPNVSLKVVKTKSSTSSADPTTEDTGVDTVVEVRANCNIDAGSETFNQYRSEEEENMPYARFFTRFGFVPGIMEPMENLLQDKSPIFWPKKVEV